MDRPFSDCKEDRPLNLQIAGFTGVGGELTSKWFSSQALFFLTVLILFFLYINKWFDLFLFALL